VCHGQVRDGAGHGDIRLRMQPCYGSYDVLQAGLTVCTPVFNTLLRLTAQDGASTATLEDMLEDALNRGVLLFNPTECTGYPLPGCSSCMLVCLDTVTCTRCCPTN